MLADLIFDSLPKASYLIDGMLCDHLYCLNNGAETSFHIGIYWHYGGYYICVNGASQLHSLCFLLCASGIV